MSEELESEELKFEEFDINDPALGKVAPEVDTEAIPKQHRMAPPPDGYHWVNARLANREGKPSVYVKGKRTPDGKILDGKVVAAIDCRIYDEEAEQEMGFLRTWYPTTQVFAGQTGSLLTALCKLGGKPIKAGSSFDTIVKTVNELFEEKGDAGVRLLVKTRWIKSVPRAEEMKNPDGSPTGIFTYVLKPGTTEKIYDELKGEKRIKAQAALQGVDEAQAHLFLDPVTGEERSAMAEVSSLEDPALLVSE
jgi:hypothetical protein